jgi:hypothetical protein
LRGIAITGLLTRLEGYETAHFRAKKAVFWLKTDLKPAQIGLKLAVLRANPLVSPPYKLFISGILRMFVGL